MRLAPALFLAGLASLWLALPLAAAQPAAANTANPAPDSGECGQTRYLLGIPSWDRGLGRCDNIPGRDLLTSDKAKILANNIAAIATHISAFIAIGFIIYGGFAYVLSSGNSDKAGEARKIIINAAIGAVIVIMARVLTEVIYRNLTGS